MSAEAVAWAMRQTAGGGIRKAVLVAIADHVNGQTGRAEVSLRLLADSTEFSYKAVQRAVDYLGQRGLLLRTRRLSFGYEFLLAAPDRSQRPISIAPAQEDQVQETYPAASDRSQGPIASPLEEQDDRSQRPITSQSTSSVRGLVPEVQDLQDQLPIEEGRELEGGETTLRAEVDCAIFETCAIRPPGQVNRRKVNQIEGHLSIRVLEMFNEIFETRYTAADHCGKIIMRLREHPELALEQHRQIQETAQSDPWWKGPASPSVIYGNGAIFEQQIVRAEQAQQGSSASPGGRMSFMEAVRRTA